METNKESRGEDEERPTRGGELPTRHPAAEEGPHPRRILTRSSLLVREVWLTV